MPKSKMRSTTFRLSEDGINYLNDTFDESGANSKGEFLTQLLDLWNEGRQEPEIKTVTVERNLAPEEILFSLSPSQLYGIRGTVLSSPDFAEKQNQVIDRLRSEKPFLYWGQLFEPEFQTLWIKNIPLTKTMSAEEKEKAIKHNMAAFLVNMFFVHLIEGKITDSQIDAESLKDFIHKTLPKKEVKQESKTENHEQGSKQSHSIG